MAVAGAALAERDERYGVEEADDGALHLGGEEGNGGEHGRGEMRCGLQVG